MKTKCKFLKKIIKSLTLITKFFIKNKNEIMKLFQAIKKVWLPLVIFCIVLVSCNITRNVTNTAQTIQRGDTTHVIQTKTTEIITLKLDKQ